MRGGGKSDGEERGRRMMPQLTGDRSQVMSTAALAGVQR